MGIKLKPSITAALDRGCHCWSSGESFKLSARCWEHRNVTWCEEHKDYDCGCPKAVKVWL